MKKVTIALLLLLGIIFISSYFVFTKKPARNIESHSIPTSKTIINNVTSGSQTPSTTADGFEEIRRRLQKNLIETATNLLIDTYSKDGWDLVYLTQGDINDDNINDYVLYAQDTNNKHIKKFPDSIGKSRELIVLLSAKDGNYENVTNTAQISPLWCGECGGYRYGNDYLISANIQSSTLSIVQTTGALAPGGIPTQWTDGVDVLYKDGQWFRLKFFSDSIDLDDQNNETLDHYEKTYTYTPNGNGGYITSSSTKQVTGPKAR